MPTLTVMVAVEVTPDVPVALKVTTVVPRANLEPLGFEDVTGMSGSAASLAVGGVKRTTVPFRPVAFTDSDVGTPWSTGVSRTLTRKAALDTLP
jgi:hypothetical protein